MPKYFAGLVAQLADPGLGALQIASAYAASRDLHDHVAGAGLRVGQGFDRQGLAGLPDYCCFHNVRRSWAAI
jgi:hypothetical protein